MAAKKGESPKTILRDVCGYVEPEHMMAIMGPSGSGKLLPGLSNLLEAFVAWYLRAHARPRHL
jgi:ABC-type lipoprotein export system ATPase subunit